MKSPWRIVPNVVSCPAMAAHDPNLLIIESTNTSVDVIKKDMKIMSIFLKDNIPES